MESLKLGWTIDCIEKGKRERERAGEEDGEMEKRKKEGRGRGREKEVKRKRKRRKEEGKEKRTERHCFFPSPPMSLGGCLTPQPSNLDPRCL
jgi:hypothetical protein